MRLTPSNSVTCPGDHGDIFSHQAAMRIKEKEIRAPEPGALRQGCVALRVHGFCSPVTGAEVQDVRLWGIGSLIEGCVSSPGTESADRGWGTGACTLSPHFRYGGRGVTLCKYTLEVGG